MPLHQILQTIFLFRRLHRSNRIAKMENEPSSVSLNRKMSSQVEMKIEFREGDEETTDIMKSMYS